MSGTGAISTTWRRELSTSFFFFLQGKAQKEIHAILTETLARFLPSRAKNLSALLYVFIVACYNFFLRIYKEGNKQIIVEHSDFRYNIDIISI